MLLATVGSTLVFQGIVGQLESFEVFVTLSILPLWALWVAERLFARPCDLGQPLEPGPAASSAPGSPGGQCGPNGTSGATALGGARAPARL